MENAITQRISVWLFGRTEVHEHPPDMVDTLVDAAPTTELLMEFGRSLLRANEERITAIDSKATVIVGYSTAILALLVARYVTLAGQPVWRTLPLLVATLFAVFGCIWGGLTLRAARNWRNMSETTWFPGDSAIAGDADRLRRWYLKAMHQSFQDNHRTTDKKAGELIRAQLSVAAAGVCLGLALIADACAAILQRL